VMVMYAIPMLLSLSPLAIHAFTLLWTALTAVLIGRVAGRMLGATAAWPAGVFYWLAYAGINYWSMGLRDGGRAPLINHAFLASNGYFVMQVLRRHQWERLADLLDEPGWLTDPRLAQPSDWFDHLDDVVRPAVERWAAARTKFAAAEALGRAGVAAGPVNTPGDVIADPHLRRRNMIVAMDRVDGVADPILSPGNPVKMSRLVEDESSRVPWVGEHTSQVLREELGLSDSELEVLRTNGVISDDGGAVALRVDEVED